MEQSRFVSTRLEGVSLSLRSRKGRIHNYWPLQAYLALTVLLGIAVVASPSLWGVIVLAAAIATVLLYLRVRRDRTSRLYRGWVTKTGRDHHEDRRYITFMIEGSRIIFYLHPARSAPPTPGSWVVFRAHYNPTGVYQVSSINGQWDS